MLVIALTGGIGSGKTTVSELFKSKNIPIIDTDVIARQIVEKNKPAYFEIINLFGEDILNHNKNINRDTLRNIIFSSDEKRLQLEKLLHPIIWDEVNSQLSIIKTSKNKPAFSIIVVPLLLENLTENKPVKFDRILVIDTEEQIQIERAIKRDNSDESIIKNIMKNQVSRQVRLKAADDVIKNNDDLTSLLESVENLHNQYLKM